MSNVVRKPIVVGNWKMNKNNAETKEFIQVCDQHCHDKADFGIAPSFLSLNTAVSHASNLLIAAQNCHFEKSGAFTGEVAIPMLEEIGVRYVIVGHSERRQYDNETDEKINKKVHALFAAGMVPIVCVGETLTEFEANQTEAVVRRQVKDCLAGLSKEDAAKVVVAYEPVWAIGTGKSATMEIAQATCKIVRQQVLEMFDESVANQLRIQYGGSVKPENIKEYLSQEDIDGALIGGASLKTDSFIEIINALK